MVLTFVDLVQDIEVLAPVILAIEAEPALDQRIVVSQWLEARSPRTALWLRRNGLRFRWVRRTAVAAGSAPGLAHVSAVLTASESSHPAHAAGHALAARAVAAGLPAYTLQHGLENVGLHAAEGLDYRFASSVVFTWTDAIGADPGLADETRAKLVPVGRPRLARAPAEPTFDAAVFENLHGRRYDDGDRAVFLAGLEALTAAGASFVLRPHPAGVWGARLGERFAGRAGVVIQSAAHVATSLETATEVAATARRVITTPSTTALDALEANRPVALAVAGGGLYARLPVLASPQAWPAFVLGPPPALDATAVPTLASADASSRVVRRLRDDLASLW